MADETDPPAGSWDPMRPSVDPFTPQAAMRADGGLTPIGAPMVMATAYDLVRDGFQHPECLTARQPGGRQSDAINHMDGPEHKGLRALVGRAFRPRALRGVDDTISEIAHMLINELPEGGTDFVPAFTSPLPAIVFCGLLGIPADDRADFLTWSDDIIDHSFSPEPAPSESKMLAYVQNQIDLARATPGDTLLHHLIDDSDGAGQITDAQLLATVRLLIIAGNETTANLLATLFHQLLVDRDRWEAVKADRELVNAAVEEALRYDPPLNWVPRHASHGTCPVGDQEVPEGTVLLLGLGAANRDPDVFPDPDTFDIHRKDESTGHMTFGFGAHFCLGSTLARMEARAALDVVLDRLPDLSLVPDYTFAPKGPVMMRGAKTLDVTY